MRDRAYQEALALVQESNRLLAQADREMASDLARWLARSENEREARDEWYREVLMTWLERYAEELDLLQLGLDLVGLYPIFGEPADIINGAISLYRGNHLDASLSLFSAIPLAGDLVAKPVKFGKHAGKYGPKAVKWLKKKNLKLGDELAALLKSDDVASFGKNGDKLKEVSEGVAKNASGAGRGVWDELGPGLRGEAIEKRLGQNLPQTFPVIDKFMDGVATSIKSMDLGAEKYQNMDTLARVGKGYIDKVAGFNGAKRAGFEIEPSEITGRALDLAVPPGATEVQRQALQGLVEYGQTQGVFVNIVELF